MAGMYTDQPDLMARGCNYTRDCCLAGIDRIRQIVEMLPRTAPEESPRVRNKQSSLCCRYLQMSSNGEDVKCNLGEPVEIGGRISITVENAASFLQPPRVLGQHPETGWDVTLRSGKYGMYYQHGRTSASANPDKQATLKAAVHVLDRKDRKARRLFEQYGAHIT